MKWVKVAAIITVVISVALGGKWEYAQLTKPVSARDDVQVGLTFFHGNQGIPLPLLAGPSLTGSHLSSRNLLGHVVVINIWGSWCGPCNAEAPALAKVSTQTYARGVRFVGIDTRDNASAGRAFEARYNITYPSFDDPSGIVLAQLGGTVPIGAVPTTIIVDRNGIVRARMIGRIDFLTLQGLVDDAVAGRE